MEFILAQVLGGVALILACIGYFLKERNKFLLIQLIANGFYAGAFLVVGAYVGGLLTLVSIARCLYLFFAEKYTFKYTYHFIPVFIGLYVLITILFWATWWDIMPLITSTLFTIGFTIKNLQLGKLILIIPNIILVIYNILITTYTSAFLDFIEMIVILLAFLHNRESNTQFKKE